MKMTLPTILALFIFLQCDKTITEPEKIYLLFPAGRSFLCTSEVQTILNGTECHPDTVYDHCGGYWLQIDQTDLPKSGEIMIQYKRNKGDLCLFKEIDDVTENWIKESHYIDSDNELIRRKAVELTTSYQNNIEKAKQIQQFVIGHVELKIYQNSFLDKASCTYELRYGTCINFSRLFVALCRAANIPARSVWGIIYGYNNDNIYDYHHQWAEVLDNTGYWHPIDFNYTTYFDLNDIRYLDLLYAAEENTILLDRIRQPVELGNVEYFHDYPAALTGKLGFELIEDHRPNYMTVRYIYKF